MTNHSNNPDPVPFTIQDFKSSGWEEAFQGLKNSACISSSFQKQANKATEEGKSTQSEILQLLSSVCSMSLQPMSPNAPFSPYLQLRTGRSAGPDDFSEMDMDFFQQILPSVTDPWLKARLADLIWLRRRSQTNIGLMAIDAYMETPITRESFSSEGGLYWMRALRLIRMLKKIAGEREKAVENKLVNACGSSEVRDGFLGRWIANILRTFDLGWDKREIIANKMTFLATEFEDQKDYHRARGYYEVAHFWRRIFGQEEESFGAIASLAETWNVEASIYEGRGNFIGASHCLEKAIQSYRLIPQKYRGILGVEQKPLQLQAQLSKIGPRIIENLVPISLPVDDIFAMVPQAQQLIQGKELVKALSVLLGFYGGVVLSEAKEQAERELKKFHLGIFGSTTIVSSGDGRVVEKRPSIVTATSDTEAHEEAVRDEMLRQYLLEIGVVANGRILPALETMIIEHRLTEEFFVDLCQQSTIVPPKRAKAFGKMLFAGYDLDFDSVIHRLVPQMEEMVRYHLKAASVVTTVMDQQGIEDEVNLGTLLERPEAISIFGQDRVFEMAALFCKKSGPKFRHGLAHGLLEEEDLSSSLAAYAWWFALKLVLSPFWNPLVKA